MEYTIADMFFVIGRVLYGGFFVMSGWSHFKNNDLLASYAAAKGIDSPKQVVYATGLLIFLGGLGIIAGVYPEISITFLAVFLIPVSFKMHAFWKEMDPQVRAAERQNFLKNIALLGAALMFLSLPQSLGSRTASAWVLSLF